MDDYILVSRSIGSTPCKIVLRGGKLAVEDLERTFNAIVDGVEFTDDDEVMTLLPSKKRTITPRGGTGQACCYVLVSKRNLISMREFCMTPIPSIRYSAELDPNNHNLWPEQAVGNKVTRSLTGYFKCEKVKQWDLDIEQLFADHLRLYENNASFNGFETLKISQDDGQVNQETDCEYFLSTKISSFLKKFHDKCLKTTETSTMKITRNYGTFEANPSDLLIHYKLNDIQEHYVPIEFELEKLFQADFKERANESIKTHQSIMEFYNNCQHHKGVCMCSHHICKAVFQIYFSMRTQYRRFGLLTTLEKNYICMLTEEGELHMAGPFARSPEIGQPSHPLFKLIFLLLSMEIESNKLVFKTNAVDLDAMTVETLPSNCKQACKMAKLQLRRNSVNAQAHEIRSDSIGGSISKAKKSAQLMRSFPSSRLLSGESLTIEFNESTYLGYGRSGKVFRGKFRGNDVAVKMTALPRMHSLDQEAIISEMKNEAKILKRLNKSSFPHAPLLYYSGHYYGNMFYVNVTELIQGQHKEIENLNRNEKTRIRKAVDSLHALKIIHNDLKPDNIIIGRNGHVTIIDYGFAKISRKSLVDVSNESNYNLF